MDLTALRRTPPGPDEQAPYYAKYIALVPAADIVETLEQQRRETAALLSSLSEAQGGHRYAPDKWTIKQAAGHVNDTERVFAYRALRISRGDPTPIEGFDQDTYVLQGPSANARLADIAAEFDTIRHSTIALFRQLDAEAWLRRGVANKNEVTVRALAWIIAGHDLHHRAILRERYLA